MGRVYLVTGGCRSGKSSFAQQLCEKLSTQPIYLATAKVFDADFSDRIKRHQSDRGDQWTTIEEEMELSLHCEKFHSRVVMVDCLTLWLTNFMMAEGAFNSAEDGDNTKDATAGDDLSAPERALERAKEEFKKMIQPWDATFIFVTNEIGSGTHADSDMTRKFVDCQGWFNQHIAKQADRVYHMVAGVPNLIKEPAVDPRTGTTKIPSKDQLEEAKMVDKFLSTRSKTLDDKGYVLISNDPQKGRIVAKFQSSMLNDKGEVCDLEGNRIHCCGDDANKKQRPEPMIIWEGRTAKEITVKMFEEWEHANIFTPNHAAYLGREAQRAEQCLLSGTFYQQD